MMLKKNKNNSKSTINDNKENVQSYKQDRITKRDQHAMI